MRVWIEPTLDEERLLLEVLNTTSVVGGALTDQLAPDTVGRAWLRAHGSTGSQVELDACRRVRATLQNVVRGGADEGGTLRKLLDSLRLKPHLDDAGELRWDADVSATEQMAARLLLTWIGLEVRHPGRLRPCGNPECRKFLIDHSRSGTARWCSMASCGNRMKSRRHHARQRPVTARATGTEEVDR